MLCEQLDGARIGQRLQRNRLPFTQVCRTTNHDDPEPNRGIQPRNSLARDCYVVSRIDAIYDEQCRSIRDIFDPAIRQIDRVCVVDL
jgi:hypothetical protein